MIVHDLEVFGRNTDSQTRCAHYHSEIDVIAIKFKCCGHWFPCSECHAELSDHAAEVWKIDERCTAAVLCGSCGHRLTITEYFECGSECPQCRQKFNPGCARHYHLYFEI